MRVAWLLWALFAVASISALLLAKPATAQQTRRAYCDGDVCVVRKQDLLDLMHRANRAEDKCGRVGL